LILPLIDSEAKETLKDLIDSEIKLFVNLGLFGETLVTGDVTCRKYKDFPYVKHSARIGNFPIITGPEGQEIHSNSRIDNHKSRNLIL